MLRIYRTIISLHLIPTTIDSKINTLTKDVICEAAYLPLSIIIVGIGNSDFSHMIELDGDKIPIKNKKGVQIERDIVQFVRFNDFKNNSINLSEEVLKEVPDQVEQYYRRYLNFKGM
jgi:hypothetical protein